MLEKLTLTIFIKRSMAITKHQLPNRRQDLGMTQRRLEPKLVSLTCSKIRGLFYIGTLILLSACATIEETPTEPTSAETSSTSPKLSADPIKGAARNQIVFAQTALKTLGYSIGKVDGIWGPRSVTAIKAFENDRNITTANGFLSQWNLDELAKVSKLDPTISIPLPKRLTGVGAKLKGKLKETGPQLIIVENDYSVFLEPNPYSKMIFELQSGTGIYVINESENWYEIESINRRKGYIQAD